MKYLILLTVILDRLLISWRDEERVIKLTHNLFFIRKLPVLLCMMDGIYAWISGYPASKYCIILQMWSYCISSAVRQEKFNTASFPRSWSTKCIWKYMINTRLYNDQSIAIFLHIGSFIQLLLWCPKHFPLICPWSTHTTRVTGYFSGISYCLKHASFSFDSYIQFYNTYLHLLLPWNHIFF